MRYKEASEHVHGRTSGEALNWTLGSGIASNLYYLNLFMWPVRSEMNGLKFGCWVPLQHLNSAFGKFGCFDQV
ncbi:hypothetical protein EJB05_38151 [Eragrostis curvula]|uniref:Uncharacterized protein n=1 Tax=Eragrostis curvula TaxID=38414 RepID=A0A5J9TV42_9POAL|nr:hypothetical protein EJB05_38151 [Eragrostis curvula]